MYQKLLSIGHVAPEPLTPVQPPYPSWYKPELTCEYHTGIGGHNIHNVPLFSLLFRAYTSTLFTHETIVPRILHCVSKTMHDLTRSQGLLGIQSFSTKTKIIFVFVQTNKFWKFKWFLRKITIYLENLNKNLNTMRWLQSWVLTKWIMRNHFAHSCKSKAYRS